MLHDGAIDLADCAGFHRLLAQRSPVRLHVLVALLGLLIAAALLWAWSSPVDLVLRAPGRVRAADAVERIHLPAGPGSHVRIAELRVDRGDVVRAGDLLLRVDTRVLDNDIRDLRRRLESSLQENARLKRLPELEGQRHQVARAEIEAQIDEELLSRDEEAERRAAGVRLCEAELEEARREAARASLLASDGIVSQAELERVQGRARRAEEELSRARLPARLERVEVLRRKLELLDRELASKLEELRMRQAAKDREVGGTRTELANRELEREGAQVHAPLGGVVTELACREGEIAPAGAPVLSIAPRGGRRFEILLASHERREVEPGLAATVRLDAAHPQEGEKLHGIVTFVAPDSSPGAGPRGPGDAVYEVRIELEDGKCGSSRPIELGRTGFAEIRVGEDTVLGCLWKRFRGAMRLR